MKAIFNFLIVPLALVALVATVGCGSSNKSSTTSTTLATTSTSSSTGGGSAVNLTLAADANGQLKFDKTKLTAKAGKVTITMDNPSNLPHSIALESKGAEGSGVDEMGTGGKAGVAHGQKSVLTADLKPGTYKYYCPVDGHEGAGMVGTLTVK